jgi:hypothetical protein
VVLDKGNAAGRKGVFLIDASKGFRKDGPKNRLREQDLHMIVARCVGPPCRYGAEVRASCRYADRQQPSFPSHRALPTTGKARERPI